MKINDCSNLKKLKTDVATDRVNIAVLSFTREKLSQEDGVVRVVGTIPPGSGLGSHVFAVAFWAMPIGTDAFHDVFGRKDAVIISRVISHRIMVVANT